jgi:hypothetical protein
MVRRSAFSHIVGDVDCLSVEGNVAVATGVMRGRIRVLLIADATGEADIRSRLADDPWVRSDRLVITGIESWSLVVGADRLPSSDM